MGSSLGALLHELGTALAGFVFAGGVTAVASLVPALAERRLSVLAVDQCRVSSAPLASVS